MTKNTMHGILTKQFFFQFPNDIWLKFFLKTNAQYIQKISQYNHRF